MYIYLNDKKKMCKTLCFAITIGQDLSYFKGFYSQHRLIVHKKKYPVFWTLRLSSLQNQLTNWYLLNI